MKQSFAGGRASPVPFRNAAVAPHDGGIPMTTYTMTSTGARTGARMGSWLAVLAAIGGLVLAVGYGAIAALDAWRAPDGFERAALGGSLTVELAAGEIAVVYIEGSGAPSAAALELEVVSPAGTPVTIAGYPGTLQYDRGDILGTAIGRFTATTGGSYEVRSAGAGTPGVVAVGPDIGGALAAALSRAGLIAGIGIVLCAVIAIVDATVRRPLPGTF